MGSNNTLIQTTVTLKYEIGEERIVISNRRTKDAVWLARTGIGADKNPVQEIPVCIPVRNVFEFLLHTGLYSDLFYLFIFPQKTDTSITHIHIVIKVVNNV